ncbi:hypothetical protein KM043_015520 [Ampulex compressa]|nr:hypothetical protein KM043_015520 [Ampulex compressa]
MPLANSASTARAEPHLPAPPTPSRPWSPPMVPVHDPHITRLASAVLFRREISPGRLHTSLCYTLRQIPDNPGGKGDRSTSSVFGKDLDIYVLTRTQATTWENAYTFLVNGVRDIGRHVSIPQIILQIPKSRYPAEESIGEKYDSKRNLPRGTPSFHPLSQRAPYGGRNSIPGRKSESVRATSRTVIGISIPLAAVQPTLAPLEGTFCPSQKEETGGARLAEGGRVRNVGRSVLTMPVSCKPALGNEHPADRVVVLLRREGLPNAGMTERVNVAVTRAD